VFVLCECETLSLRKCRGNMDITPALHSEDLRLKLSIYHGIWFSLWRFGTFPFAGFEVLTSVVMKSSIFWDITQCSPLKVNHSFGGTRHHHFPSRRISQIRNQHEAGSKLPYYLWVMFRPWRWRQHVPLRIWFTFNGLHGVIYQSLEYFFPFVLKWIYSGGLARVSSCRMASGPP
jgi:hypothetical protein